jgi:hypothetical protein
MPILRDGKTGDPLARMQQENCIKRPEGSLVRHRRSRCERMEHEENALHRDDAAGVRSFRPDGREWQAFDELRPLHSS